MPLKSIITVDQKPTNRLSFVSIDYEALLPVPKHNVIQAENHKCEKFYNIEFEIKSSAGTVSYVQLVSFRLSKLESIFILFFVEFHGNNICLTWFSEILKHRIANKKLEFGFNVNTAA